MAFQGLPGPDPAKGPGARPFGNPRLCGGLPPPTTPTRFNGVRKTAKATGRYRMKATG